MVETDDRIGGCTSGGCTSGGFTAPREAVTDAHAGCGAARRAVLRGWGVV
ncbi:hypothetical protein AB0M39_24370 [Streptomyces sp. NPDC051907]